MNTLIQIVLKVLKSPIFWLVTLLLALSITCTIQHKNIVQKGQEVARLESNQTSLLSQVEYYRTENGELVASVQALTLKKEEFESLMPKYEKEIKALKIELSNVRNISHVETETDVDIVAPVTSPAVVADSSIVEAAEVPENEGQQEEYPKEFSWMDDWTEVRGKIYADSVSCSIVCRDSLVLVAHYAKKKCLFKKKGKLIKYDVRSKNPHVKVIGAELIDVIE